MAKKYVSFREAAKSLGITADELEQHRAAGAIRGFADRGSWKFRKQDVAEFSRSRQADSSPDIPLSDDASDTGKGVSDQLESSDSDVRLFSQESAIDDEDFTDVSDSDSDVRLAGDSGPLLESDDSSASNTSAIQFDGDSDEAMSDSDSDVKLSVDRTDSDIRLADDQSDSDSDVVVSADSDLRLRDDQADTEAISLQDDSDLKLIDDSGISLEADDSGISLEGIDSGFGDDSGITLDAPDSGIAIAADQDSGISLEGDMGSTKPMPMQAIPGTGDAVVDTGAQTKHMDAPEPESTSEFDLERLEVEGDEDDFATDTSVLMFDDEGTDTGERAAVADDEGFDDADFEDDFAGEFEDDAMDDVFDAQDEDDGFDAGESHVGGFVSPDAVGAMVAAEAPWGNGLTALVGVGTVASLLCAFAGFELVRTMWMWFVPGGEGSSFLSMIGGLFG